jgi:hypothetical protein
VSKIASLTTLSRAVVKSRQEVVSMGDLTGSQAFPPVRARD